MKKNGLEINTVVSPSNISRTKKRKISEAYANMHPSFLPSAALLPPIKRRRLIGVEVDPKITRELIINDNFLLAEYHSNFPNLLHDSLQQLSKEERWKNVKMKACDNQWMAACIGSKEIYYWSTIARTRAKMHGRPIKSAFNEDCYYVDISSLPKNEEIELSGIDHLHLLYPFATSHASLRLHRPCTGNGSDIQTRIFNPKQTYVNPFMPSNPLDTTENIVPIFPTDNARGIGIDAFVFIDNRHENFYCVQHSPRFKNNKLTLHDSNDAIITIPLPMKYQEYSPNQDNQGEKITNSILLPQSKTDSTPGINYRVLLGTSLGRLFAITLTIINHGEPGDHRKIQINHSLEILLALGNEHEGFGGHWLSSIFNSILRGESIDSIICRPKLDTSFDETLLKVLRASGINGSHHLEVKSICSGLTHTRTQNVIYVLRKYSIDCIGLSHSTHELWWSYPLIKDMAPFNNRKLEPLKISLLGQGLSVLAGCIDDVYGATLRLYMYEILDINSAAFGQALSLYHTIEIPLQEPENIIIRSLSNLHFDTMWNYRNDIETDSLLLIDDSISESFRSRSRSRSSLSMEYIPPLQRQSSVGFFMFQRDTEASQIVNNQHLLIAPVAVIWSDTSTTSQQNSSFVSIVPLMHKSDDEVRKRIYEDYNYIYHNAMDQENSPDYRTSESLILTLNLSRYLKAPSTGASPSLDLSSYHWQSHMAMYGGGVVNLPFDFNKATEAITLNEALQCEEDQEALNKDEEEKLGEDQDMASQENFSRKTNFQDMKMEQGPKQRSCIKQLPGGGYVYFLNEKYEIMRVKFSLSCARAAKTDLATHHKERQRNEQKRKEQKLKLAFTEFEQGPKGYPRASRIVQDLDVSTQELSNFVVKLSENILNCSLAQPFSQKQQQDEENRVEKLGRRQLDIKLKTYESYINFLKECSESPSSVLWNRITYQAQYAVTEHREFLDVAYVLYDYITNENENISDMNMVQDSFQKVIIDVDVDAEMTFPPTQDIIHQQQLAVLKKSFMDVLIDVVICARNDNRLIISGYDIVDLFFTKVGEVNFVLQWLPKLLSAFLSHLSSRYSPNTTVGISTAEDNTSAEDKVKACLNTLFQNHSLNVETSENIMVIKIALIRIVLQLVQNMLNTAIKRQENFAHTYPNKPIDQYEREPWTYSSKTRDILKILINFVITIAPAVFKDMKSNNEAMQDDIEVDRNAPNWSSTLTYLLKKEWSELYQTVQSLCSILLKALSFASDIKSDEKKKEKKKKVGNFCVMQKFNQI